MEQKPSPPPPPRSDEEEDGLMGCGMGGTGDIAGGDLDLMEEFLLATPGLDLSEFWHPGAASPFSPLFDIGSSVTTLTTPAPAAGEDDRDEAEMPSRGGGGLEVSPAHRGWTFQTAPQEVAVEPTVKERLRRALERIASQSQSQAQRGDGELLVQVWVPTRIGDRQVLTTCGQPFWLDRRNQRLANYRTVSMKYQFSADESARADLGLPGRVFVGRVPEWTPDVRYFSTEEYPRVQHAQYFDIRGSVALPVFEPRSRACLGVVELVMTTQKVNYSAEIENICNALKVDLRNTAPFDSPKPKKMPMLCRPPCYALNVFDEMSLGKDVITAGHTNPQSNQSFHFSYLGVILVLIKLHFVENCRKLISGALMFQVILVPR